MNAPDQQDARSAALDQMKALAVELRGDWSMFSDAWEAVDTAIQQAGGIAALLCENDTDPEAMALWAARDLLWGAHKALQTVWDVHRRLHIAAQPFEADRLISISNAHALAILDNAERQHD